MTNTPKVNIADDLDDFAPEGIQPEPQRKIGPQWSGRKTRIRLQYPIHRGTPDKPAGRNLDSTTPCIDCGEPGHQFHASASRVDGQWVGPEGDSLGRWEEAGMLRGTQQARERADRQRRRDELIGPEASLVLTAANLDHLMKYEMKNGAINLSIEGQIRSDGVTSAIERLVDKLGGAPVEK